MTEQQTPASVVEALGALRWNFERIAALHPNDQPCYPEGSERSGRPFGTGDLRHFIATLTEAAALIERLSADREGLREALAGLLALPVAEKAFHYLDKGIGTKTAEAAWMVARAALTQGESRQTGWVEWHGGPNPVPGQIVDWRNRFGMKSTVLSDDLLGWEWPHVRGPDNDIVAYRVSAADGGGE